MNRPAPDPVSSFTAPAAARLLSPALLLSLAAAFAFVVGCDDTPTPPPSVAAPPQTAPARRIDLPERPTTQQILTARRQPLPLGEIPATLEVPDPYWKLNEPAPRIVVLQGPAPAGDVTVRLSRQEVDNRFTLFSAERVKAMIDAAQADAARDPARNLLVNARDLGDARILERRTLQGDTVAWTINLFVPGGDTPGNYVPYQLGFLGLTKAQYDADRDFLESTFRTLQYVPSLRKADPANAPKGLFNQP